MERLFSPGLQLVAIGLLHNVVGLFLGFAPLREILSGGVIGAVEGSFERMAIFWFLWFGWMLMLLGFALRAREPEPAPRLLVAGLTAVVLGGALAIPASGFWLGLVPLAGMIIRAHWWPCCERLAFREGPPEQRP